MTTPADSDDIRKTIEIWQEEGLSPNQAWAAMKLPVFARTRSWIDVAVYMGRLIDFSRGPPNHTKAPAQQSPKPAHTARR